MQINQRRRPQLNWRTCVRARVVLLCCVGCVCPAQTAAAPVAFAHTHIESTYLCDVRLSFWRSPAATGKMECSAAALALRCEMILGRTPALFFVQFRRLTRWKGKRRDTVAGLNITLSLSSSCATAVIARRCCWLSADLSLFWWHLLRAASFLSLLWVASAPHPTGDKHVLWSPTFWK